MYFVRVTLWGRGQRTNRRSINILAWNLNSAVTSSEACCFKAKQLPARAQVVICGAGIAGTSLAYHLPRVGLKDVILLEQGKLGCGTSWHSAGLLGVSRGSIAHTKICGISEELYSNLEEETGLATGCKATGNLILARNKDRLTALRRNQAIARSCGYESEIISPQKVGNICPILNTSDLTGALYLPGLSMGNPNDLCQSLAKGAKQQGAQVFEGVCVEEVVVESERVTGVKTNQGDIECDIFVNCAGQWARDLGNLSTPPVNVPLHSTELYYIITKPLEGVVPNMPSIRDPDGCMYVREWSGGLLAGWYDGLTCFEDGIPKPFEFQLLPKEWDDIQPLMDEVLKCFPVMKNAEIRQLINGPESYTPDLHAIMGESPNVMIECP